jgi:hypothetical protein
MKNLLISLILILSTSIGYAQRGCLNPYISVKLTKSNSEEALFQLCYDGKADYLVLTQCYNKSPETITSAEVGNYLLRGKRLALFTTNNSKFHFKLVDEKIVTDTLDECNKYTVYSYYEVNRSKLRLMLLGAVENIEIIGDSSVEFFEVTYPQSTELYKMVYTYFKWKKWEN